MAAIRSSRWANIEATAEGREAKLVDPAGMRVRIGAVTRDLAGTPAATTATARGTGAETGTGADTGIGADTGTGAVIDPTSGATGITVATATATATATVDWDTRPASSFACIEGMHLNQE